MITQGNFGHGYVHYYVSMKVATVGISSIIDLLWSTWVISITSSENKIDYPFVIVIIKARLSISLLL